MLKRQLLRSLCVRSADLVRILSGPRRPCHVIHSPLLPVEVPKGNFVDFVLHRTRQTPHLHGKTAIINGATGERFAYKDIFQAVRSVASALHRMGLRKGDVVCIFAENSPEFVFALYGALSAGIIVSCASASFKEGDLEYQLRNCNAKYLITSTKCLPVAKHAAGASGQIKKIIVIDGDGSESTVPFDVLLNDDGGADPSKEVEIDEMRDLAVLPYSSGTTGLPKGVMLSHSNISVNLRQVLLVLPCYTHDVSLGIMPFTHIYGMIPIIGATLLMGATMVTQPSFTPKLFLEAITEHKVNIMHIVPPIVLFMKDHPDAQECDKSNVRLIVCGAAPLAHETQEEFYEYMKRSNPFIQIVQAFGLSETSPAILGCPVGVMKTGSVGVVMSNQEVKVVCTETGDSLGPHKRGEIVVRGPNIMQGYLNNEEATRNTIRDGWLYTGDIGYYDDQQYFYIVDRMKELIKYKGLQVPPAELEGILLLHPAITDAAVVPREDLRVGELPAAFVVLSSDCAAPPSPAEVAQFVAERVADHKQLRGGVFFTKEIPKSPSGKILRRILRERLAEQK